MAAPQISLHTGLKKFPSLPLFIPLCLVVAVLRFWLPSQPLQWALDGTLFVVGSALAFLVFLFEHQFGKIATRVGETLANNRLTSDLPSVTASPTSLTDSSPLKQSLILFVLPIVGIFLLSSSRAPVGLGFLLGVSWIYFADILTFFQNRPSDFPAEYFPPQQAQSRSVQTALAWYVIYMVALVIALLLL
jgi:hypothetical protein